MCSFSGVAVLLCLTTWSLAAPAPDPQCVGTTLDNGLVLFRLPRSITEKMTDRLCNADWSIDVNAKFFLLSLNLFF